MKRGIWVSFLLCLLTPSGQASAELCTIDAVPAATLLLPYFEVDLEANPRQGGRYAVFDQQRLGNADDRPRLDMERLVAAGVGLRHLPDRL